MKNDGRDVLDSAEQLEMLLTSEAIRARPALESDCLKGIKRFYRRCNAYAGGKPGIVLVSEDAFDELVRANIRPFTLPTSLVSMWSYLTGPGDQEDFAELIKVALPCKVLRARFLKENDEMAPGLRPIPVYWTIHAILLQSMRSAKSISHGPSLSERKLPRLSRRGPKRAVRALLCSCLAFAFCAAVKLYAPIGIPLLSFVLWRVVLFAAVVTALIAITTISAMFPMSIGIVASVLVSSLSTLACRFEMTSRIQGS